MIFRCLLRKFGWISHKNLLVEGYGRGQFCYVSTIFKSFIKLFLFISEFSYCCWFVQNIGLHQCFLNSHLNGNYITGNGKHSPEISILVGGPSSKSWVKSFRILSRCRQEFCRITLHGLHFSAYSWNKRRNLTLNISMHLKIHIVHTLPSFKLKNITQDTNFQFCNNFFNVSSRPKREAVFLQ